MPEASWAQRQVEERELTDRVCSRQCATSNALARRKVAIAGDGFGLSKEWARAEVCLCLLWVKLERVEETEAEAVCELWGDFEIRG